MILKMMMRMVIKHNDMDTDGNVKVDIDTGDAIDDIKDEDDTDNAIKTHNAIWRTEFRKH